MENKLKSWQSWLLFGGAMTLLFVLGVIISSLMERKAEVADVIYNKKVEITGIESRSPIFGENYPREYQTWVDTTATDYRTGGPCARAGDFAPAPAESPLPCHLLA